jgi:hypothetical protein
MLKTVLLLFVIAGVAKESFQIEPEVVSAL